MLNSTPLFTIITICFNAEKEIEKTILSVISQRKDLFQYIIIDGASKDRTNSIVSKYIENIDTYISEKDKGIYDAMNKAIPYIKGEYVLYMNAGDRFHSDDILTKIENKCKSKADIIYGDVVLDYGEFKRCIPSKSEADILNKKNKDMPFCHQSVFFHREHFRDKVFDLNYKICADYDFFLNVIRKDNIRIDRNDFPFSCIELGGVSDIRRVELLEEKRAIYKKYYKYSLVDELFYFYKLLKSSLFSRLRLKYRHVWYYLVRKKN